MISASDYLIPKELEVNPCKIDKVLFIGSCMSEDYIKSFSASLPHIYFEQILYNHLTKLPERPTYHPSDYNVHVIQLPIRHILSDKIIRFQDFVNDSEGFIKDALNLLRLMLEETLAYNRRYNTLTLVSNFIVPQGEFVAGSECVGSSLDLRSVIAQLNLELAEQIRKHQNVFLLDIETIAGCIGKRYFLDDLISFSSHGGFWFPNWDVFETDRIETPVQIEAISPSHLNHFLEAVWRRIESAWRIANQVDQVKLVIFDLDDTMWRGLIGEHYGDELKRVTAGWPLGMQEIVHHLKARGILTAICSKNSLEIVQERWDRAVSEGFVILDEFSFVEIGWLPKVEAIGRIISQSNLTPKSVVFVDDNPVERQSVLAAFPEIRVLPAQPFTTRRILLNSPETQVPRITSETTLRETSIQNMKIREEARSIMSREDFLASLDCKISLFQIQSINDVSFPRAAELLNKTNQFNTTGERWTFEALSGFIGEGGEIWCFTVDDRFTSYGLVGVILLNDRHFAQFVMSCRVLGLDVETSAIKTLINKKMQTARGKQDFTATLKITKHNAPSRTVYDKLGFIRESGNSEKLYFSPIDALSVDPHLQISLRETPAENNCPPKPIVQFMIERGPFMISQKFANKEAERLRRRGFDEQFYLTIHKDVAQSGLDPVEHFVRHGRKEGRRYRVIAGENPI